MGDGPRVKEIPFSDFRNKLLNDDVGADRVNSLMQLLMKLIGFSISIHVTPLDPSTDKLTVWYSRYKSSNEDISNDP